jgi:LPXTG-motif cell wall-anchored protein
VKQQKFGGVNVMRQKRYREAIGATTTHYKLYKAKKNWLIAGIALFSFGIGAASVTQATPVAAATAITAGTAPATATTTSSSATSSAATPAASSAASSAATDSVSSTSEAASNATSSTTVTSSSAVSSATPASSVASSTVTDNTATSSAAVLSAATASSSAISNVAPVSSDAAITSTAASSAASVATKATTTNSAQYQTPPVKDGGVQDDRVGAVQPTTAGDNKVTTAGTNFTVNFNVKTGDTVTIKIDGADVSDVLYTNGPTKYAKVDNVVMSGDGASNVTTVQNQTDGAVIDTVLNDGSYQQNFNLKTLQNYTEYSTTATGYSTETVTDRKIQVFINDTLAASTTFQVNYNVVPVRLVRANYYQGFISYNADQEIFQLPNFGISGSQNKQAGSLSLNDLATLNAKSAEYRVVMPDDFVLNEAATAELNTTRPYTITQDATTHEIVLTYDLTAKAVADDDPVYVQGAFTGYNPDVRRDPGNASTPSEVIVKTPNVVSVTQQDGTVISMASSGHNKFNYVSGDTFNTSYWTSWPVDYISNANNHTIYPDLQRAAATGDTFKLSVGTAAYFGSAATNGNELIKIPSGFTTTLMDIEVAPSLLKVNDNQPIPYQITYTDGTQTIGTLTGTTNAITLDTGKVVQTIAYQFNVPNTPKLTNGQSQAEEVTGDAAYDHVEPYVSLPVVHLTLNTDPTTVIGQYPVTATLTFTNKSDQDKTDNTAGQYVQVVDGQTNAYVTVAANAQKQTNTSRGTVLTDSGTTYLSGVASKPTAGLTLSNDTTSKSTDLEAQFLNEPIFYFIAPAQTTFVVNQAALTSKIPGAVVTEYTTPDGKDAYKIDLSNATSSNFSVSGDYNYYDDQPIAVTGVFRNGTVAGYRADNGILEKLINMFDIKADDNAVEGSDDLQIFYTSKNQINDLTTGQDTNGTLTGDANAIAVNITNPTYKIQNLSGVNGFAEIQGSEDTAFSGTGTTDVYNALDANQFAVTVTNVADKALTNVNVLVNLPTKDDAYGSAFTVNLADNSNLQLPAGVTVYYGTTSQAQQTGISEPDQTGYVTGDAVTDWSAIRSIIVHTDAVASQDALAQLAFNIEDPTQLQDVGKTAYFDTGVYADNLIPIIANKTVAAKFTVQGTATVNYAFLLPDGSQVAAPQLTQTLNLGSDTITQPALTAADLPAGYSLVGADGKALTFTDSTTDYQVGQTVNSDADYSNLNGENGTATIGAIAQYDANGDTILIPVMDPNAVIQKATINYVDQDANNALLVTDPVTGLSGATQDYSAQRATTLKGLTAKGYVYVKQDGDALNDTNAVVFDTDDTADQVTTIYLKHGTTVVTPDTPTTPTETGTNTSAYDLNRTVTQTIQYVYSAGGKVAADQHQSVTFQRAAVVDQVTGEVLGYLASSDVAAYKTDASKVTLTNNSWTVTAGSADFKAIVSPDKAGYLNDLATTKAYTVTPKTGDSKLTVTYALPQKAIVNYVDDDAKGVQVHQDVLTGAPTETNDYAVVQNAVESGLTSLGYLVVGSDLPANSVITFDDQDGDQIYTVHLKHDTKTATESKTINETVTYVYAKDGSKAAAPVTDQVTFNRTNTTDQVTKAVTNGDWIAEGGDTTFEEKVSPIIVGYSADKSSIVAVTGLTADSQDVVEQVTYTLDNDQPGLPITGEETDQKATINYVDQDADNAVLKTEAFSEPSGSTLDYSATRDKTLTDLAKQGYVFVKQAGDALNTANNIAFDSDDTVDQVTTIYLKHNTTVVTPDIPTTPTETGTNTSAYDLNRTITETVQYVYSTGGKVATDQHQSVTFQRAAVVDQVTGEVLGYLAPNDVAAYKANAGNIPLTANGWTVTKGNATFNAITSPTKAGYTNDLAATKSYTVTPTTGNILLTVTYTAVAPQRAIVNYVDDDANGAQVHQDVLTGAPAETNAYANVQNAVEHGLVALGYVVVGNDLPAKSIITFDDQDGDQVYTVHLKHQTQPATANLQKVVTETVHYVYVNGTTAAPTVTDQVSFTRQGTVDQVTGQATYTAWTAENEDTTFDAKVSPTITGYTPDQTEIAAITGLTAASANVQVTVTYNKDTDGGTTTPDNPGTDGGTTTPDNPGTDGGTTIPDNPGTDGGTTTPDNSGTDGGTTTPDNPGTDGGTTTPDNPGTDGGTTTPDNPGTDGGTTTPDNPGTDGGTTTPDNPGTDGGTTTPDNPGTDGGTTTPDNPGTDDGTTTPDNPGTGGGTTTPDNPGTDGGTTTPDNPGTDGGTTTPDNPGTDGGTTTPDNPGTDGGTTTPDNPGTDVVTTPTVAQPVIPSVTATTGRDTPTVKATSATAPEATLTPQATAKAATLPQTSDANEAWLVTAGLTILGSVGLLGATTLRKRKDDNLN